MKAQNVYVICGSSIQSFASSQNVTSCIGCDKNMPGCVIAMARLNRPSLMVYGGTIQPGCSKSFDKLDIVSAFQSFGEASHPLKFYPYPPPPPNLDNISNLFFTHHIIVELVLIGSI